MIATCRELSPPDVIGKTVVLSSFGPEPRTIVGVAGDVRSFGLDAEPQPMV